MSKVRMPIFRIKVSLKDSSPLIWRQLLVSSDTKLSQFHQILQIAMGWTDSHLHLFRVGRVTFSYPHEPGDLEEMTAVDERYVKLSHLVPQRRPFRGEFHFEMEYLYDFGDSWEHEIVFEDVLMPEAKQKVPICVAGENDCPPEDSGGILYYNEMHQVKNGTASEQDDLSEERLDSEDDEDWNDEFSFRPTPFDLNAINQRLRTL